MKDGPHGRQRCTPVTRPAAAGSGFPPRENPAPRRLYHHAGSSAELLSHQDLYMRRSLLPLLILSLPIPDFRHPFSLNFKASPSEVEAGFQPTYSDQIRKVDVAEDPHLVILTKPKGYEVVERRGDRCRACRDTFVAFFRDHSPPEVNRKPS